MERVSHNIVSNDTLVRYGLNVNASVITFNVNGDNFIPTSQAFEVLNLKRNPRDGHRQCDEIIEYIKSGKIDGMSIRIRTFMNPVEFKELICKHNIMDSVKAEAFVNEIMPPRRRVMKLGIMPRNSAVDDIKSLIEQQNRKIDSFMEDAGRLQIAATLRYLDSKTFTDEKNAAIEKFKEEIRPQIIEEIRKSSDWEDEKQRLLPEIRKEVKDAFFKSQEWTDQKFKLASAFESKYAANNEDKIRSEIRDAYQASPLWTSEKRKISQQFEAKYRKESGPALEARMTVEMRPHLERKIRSEEFEKARKEAAEEGRRQGHMDLADELYGKRQKTAE